MSPRIHTRFSTAHALAAAALFVALSGTAWSATTKIDSNEIVANAIRSKQIKDGAVKQPELAANSVGAEEIIARSVGPAEVAAGSIGASHLAPNSVGPAQIAAESVGSVHLAPQSVGPATVAPGSIRAEHISTDAVGAPQIAAGSIRPNHLDVPLGVLGAIDEDDVTSNGGPQTLVTETFTIDSPVELAGDAAVQALGNTAGTIQVWVMIDGQQHGLVWTEDIAAGEREVMGWCPDWLTLDAGQHTIAIEALAGNNDVTFEQAALSVTVLPAGAVGPMS